MAWLAETDWLPKILAVGVCDWAPAGRFGAARGVNRLILCQKIVNVGIYVSDECGGN